MTDQELVLDALEQAQQILARYVEPGPRNERATLEALAIKDGKQGGHHCWRWPLLQHRPRDFRWLQIANVVAPRLH
jgi:hypothetical protein